MDESKRRKPFVALFLALFAPGLGQLYNGQFYKAAILYLGGLSLLAAIIIGGFFSSFKGMIVSLGMALAFSIGAIIDAVYSAIKLKEITLRKYNRWYIYLIYLVIVSVSTLFIKPYIKHCVPYKAFMMPAGSMAPTLLVGDHFLVDKQHYEKRAPKKGDIAVFAYPVDTSKDFIKRVIGVPGDKIQLRDKVLLVNDQPQKEGYIKHSDTRILPASASPRDNFGPLIVPPNYLFVMTIVMKAMTVGSGNLLTCQL